MTHEPTTITENVIAISITRTRWGVNRKVSSERVTTTAERQMVSANKRLIKDDSYKAIQSVDHAIRMRVASVALPSPLGDGTYLVPMALVEQLDADLVAFAVQRQAAVDAFVEAYPSLVEAAKAKLGDLFEASDYPPEEDVRGRFSLTWRYLAFETPSQLQHVSDKLWQDACARNDAALAETADLIRQTLRATALGLVDRIRERLTPGPDGEPKIFRRSMVDNAVSFLETFELRNVTSDDELPAAVTKMRAMLKGVDPRVLRDDDVVRATVQRQAAEITKQLDAMVVDTHVRQLGDD